MESSDFEVALRAYRESAELGFAPAYKRLAEIYLHGQGGVEVDDAEAVRWLTLSAEAGDAESRYNLGCEYYFGHGVEQDRVAAAEHWRLAAEQGFAAAQSNLGAVYFTGDGVAKDPAEAARWFKMAAEHGDAGGQLKFGLVCKNGFGVERDERAALHWLHAAAAQGDAEAQFQIGVCCEEGLGREADLVDAAAWYWKAAQQQHAEARQAFDRLDSRLLGMEGLGQAVGQRFMALKCFEGMGRSVDSALAYRYLDLAAKQDDPKALMAAAHCAAEGLGVARDLDAANQLCFRAAQLGDAEALYEYGVFVDDYGDYSAESHAKALTFFQEAAKKGHVVARKHVEIEWIYQEALDGDAATQRDLGLIFLKNEVLRHDFEQAEHWLKKANAQYDYMAPFELGMLYLRGGDTVTLFGRRTHAPNAAAAVALLETPARYGNTEARTTLALTYANRASGVYDLQRAMDWVDLAAANGDESAVPYVQAAYDAEVAAERAAERAHYSSIPRESDPFTPSPCAFCNGTGQVLQSRGQFLNGNYWPDTYTTCLECKGTGKLQP